MSSRKSKELRKIKPDEFARRLKVTAKQPDARFAFFLGAGCSLSSGIPLAGQLVEENWLQRLHTLRAPGRGDFENWAREELRDWSSELAGVSYGEVMEKLFLTPEERQREIERICTGRTPNFGYAVLAALMTRGNASQGDDSAPSGTTDEIDTRTEGRFNVVLTTNFDDLVQDSLFLYRQTRPLVVHHEALAGYIRPTRTRPLVVKLHGDYSLSPQNTATETAILKEAVEQNVRSLLNDRGLVFVGYGGNDESIFHMLEGLPDEALPFGVFWVSGRDPRGPLRSWLEDRDAIWVENRDFDVLMDLILREFKLTETDEYSKGVLDKWGEIQHTENELYQRMWRNAVKAIDPVFFGGVKGYADFVEEILDDAERALTLYRSAVAIEPKNSDLLGNYADFLENKCSDFDSAEEFYKKAIDENNDHAANLGNYAGFLEQRRKNFDEAKLFYTRAGNAAKSAGLNEQALSNLFHAYALESGDVRSDSLRDIKTLLATDARAHSSELAPNIERAHEINHPSADWLQPLANVIIGQMGLETLEEWGEWNEIA